ncbi:MAG: pyruvate kinase [Candidatus Omnitrophica bacterium]|nr:pyruvate kinase [Candidatus Omnitrophota bacterium]
MTSEASWKRRSAGWIKVNYGGVFVIPKTKIIATLGPASEKAGVLLKMYRAGLDVVRLNFSHGTLDEHARRIALVRRLNRQYRRHVRILGDLEGYRIRIGKLQGAKPLELKKGQTLWLTADDSPGAGDRVSFDYRGPIRQIKKGQPVFIDDGNIALVVESASPKALKTRVAVGGFLKEHKGVNMPDLKLSFKGLTDKDRAALTFCLEERLDFVAQSFVRTAADITALRDFIGKAATDHRPQMIAKIENREGIRNLGDILKVSDGIMVARGDMGVSLPVYEVPVMQKRIIRQCKAAGRFVITATQMLESMTENLRPTRAEVSDVANAILDGTDYVMLSAETAAGAHPVEAVDMMNRVIKFTEANR